MTNIIEIAGLKNEISGQIIHKDVNLNVKKGEILAIIGGSGSGKTTILRCLLMLLKPTTGVIKIFGEDIAKLDPLEAVNLRKRWGMLFQHSALFSSLTLLENIMFPIEELTKLPQKFIAQLAMLKISLVGLPLDAAHKYPFELSGGMQRRAAAARSIAMDPELLFLDEPTTGLDPRSARLFDELVLFLRDTLKLTIVMVSHDLESLKKATDRVAFVGEGKILEVAPITQLMQSKNPVIAKYFSKIL